MPPLEDIPALIEAISEPRLSSYRAFFKPQTDEELLAIYLWHEDLCAHFARILKWLEVAMRNSFHANLSKHYGARGPAGARDWYNHLALDTHSRDNVLKVTHGKSGRPIRPAPSPDDVVAKQTLAFWPKLLKAEKDSGGQPIPWNHIVPQVLPGHRQTHESYWRKADRRDAIRVRLELCTYLRNRIAHNEPIWKQGELLEETKPRHRRQRAVVAPAPNTPTEALARLQLQHDRLMELLHWLSPAAARLVRQDPAFQRGVPLLQAGTLQAYRQGQR